MTDVELDARGLEPPEPLERTLAAVALLRPGQRLRLLIHREPFPLYALLDNMGCAHRTEALPDGEFMVLIEAAPRSA
jgi:TusA-related sulfurtransferase